MPANNRKFLPLMSALLLADLALNRAINVLASDDLVWRLHDLTQGLSAALAASIVLMLVPYRMIRIKCLMALVVGIVWVDLAWAAFGAGSYAVSVALQLIAGIGLGTYYYGRAYNAPSESPRLDGHVYCLRHRPRGAQDLLISMLGMYGPNGGMSIYVGGVWYRFRKGVLVREKVGKLHASLYHVERGALATPELIAQLESMVGIKWTWRHNCLSVFGPLWSAARG